MGSQFYSSNFFKHFYYYSFVVLSLYCFYNLGNGDTFVYRTYSFWHLMTARADIFNDFYANFHVANDIPRDGMNMRVPWQIILFRAAGTSSIPVYFVFFCFLTTLAISIGLSKFEALDQKNYWPIFSYPLLFAFFRGNYEFLSFGCLFVAAAFYTASIRDMKISFFAYILAVFFKPTALVFIVLYVKPFFKHNELVKNFLVVGCLALVVVLGLFVGLGNVGENTIHILNMPASYENDYAIGDGGTLFNNSIWGFYKGMLLQSYPDYDVLLSEARQSLPGFKRLLFCIPFLTLLVLMTSDLSSIHKWFLVCCASIMYTPVAADYRLCIFIIPLFLLVNKTAQNRTINDIVLTFLCIFIVLPKHFIHFLFGEAGISMTIQSFINPVLIVVGYLLVLVSHFLFRKNSDVTA